MQSQVLNQRTSHDKQLASRNDVVLQWHSSQQKQLRAKRYLLYFTTHGESVWLHESDATVLTALHAHTVVICNVHDAEVTIETGETRT